MTAPTTDTFYRVEVYVEEHARWMEWAAWLDRASAYTERDFARGQGYSRARVVRQKTGCAS